MQIIKILQAVVLMIMLAMAASCASSKEYTSKLFRPATEAVKDSQVIAIRFLDLDETEINKENWVSTDIINGKDSSHQTIALDKLSETIPALVKANRPDSVTKTIPAESEPVAKSAGNQNGTRTKRTRNEP